MKNLATISLNFSDGETVIVSVQDNSPEILAACIRSASEGKPIYYLSSGWAGYMIQCKKPDRKLNIYISGYRCGEYSWTQDATYAKHFSRTTAEKHIMELYSRK